MTLFVVDGTPPPDSEPGRRAYWKRVGVPEGAVSIPRLVERRALELKREYLRWVAEFARSASVSSGLELRELGYSAWWNTLITEKSKFKSPDLYSALKLRALERLADEEKPERIV